MTKDELNELKEMLQQYHIDTVAEGQYRIQQDIQMLIQDINRRLA